MTDPWDAMKPLWSFVEAGLRAERNIIEQACEKALQGGQNGVLVTRDARTGRLISAVESVLVAYGTIHEIHEYPGGDVE